MKSVMIFYDKAFQERVVDILTHLNCRGFSRWQDVEGRGTNTGEPHYGSHAWPSMCSAILTVVPDTRVEQLLRELKRLDEESPMLGLRAFVWSVEQSI